VGGARRAASTGLSAILLNRGGRYPRRTLFQELEKTGFDTIISIESPQERYDLEELSERFPFVRFILLKENLSLGERINLAVSELASPLFFVLWNDLRILTSCGGADRMAERLFFTPEELRKNQSPSGCRRLCTAPVIQNVQIETLPTLIAPAFYRNTVKTLFLAPLREGMPSLYPFDGVGIYDKDRFKKLGGYDGSLKNSYWQLMDFGFRAHLWGEAIQSTQMIRLSYSGETPPEDSTADENYRQFYLKNMAPVFRGDMAHIPLRRFPGYLYRSGGDLFQAWSDFSEGRRWVWENRFRFRRDARSLTDLWDYSEDGQGGEVPPNGNPRDTEEPAGGAPILPFGKRNAQIPKECAKP
jgi:hypothetical protein